MKKLLIVIAAIVVGLPAWARYDFMLTVETGQQLYFQINADSTSVSVVYPGTSASYYGDLRKPSGSLAIPDTVTHAGRSFAVSAIKGRAFSDCTELREVTTPRAMQIVGSHAFYGCTSLTRITFNEGLVGLANNALQGCTALANVQLPSTLTTIGSNTFADCETMESVVLPSNVATIGAGAFSNCNHLLSIALNEGLTAVSDNMFSGCTRLQHIAIPTTVERIGDYAFDGCTRLTTIELHEGIREVGSYSFYHCANLYTITLPSSVQTVGDYAFYMCDNLNSIYLGYGVTSIGEYCLQYCNRLAIISIKAPTPPALGTTALGNLDGYKRIYVPCGRMDAYQHYIIWRTYADLMTENCNILDIDSTDQRPAVHIAAEGRGIRILNAEGMVVEVYDAMGRRVARCHGEASLRIDVGRRGMYVVKVGGKKAEKIIVG